MGAFNYSVRAPAIQEVASVRMFEIFAWVPGAEQEVSALVEVHVVNRAPMLTCEDLVVDEAVNTKCPVFGRVRTAGTDTAHFPACFGAAGDLRQLAQIGDSRD